MPQTRTPKDETKLNEQLESLFEVLEQTQAQIRAKAGKLEHGQMSKELQEKLLLMLALPSQPPYL